MMKAMIGLLLLVPLMASGCASRTGSAAAGALGGAAAGGGAYEYRLHQAMQRIEQDYKDGKMDEKEYKARKDEIQRLQLFR